MRKRSGNKKGSGVWGGVGGCGVGCENPTRIESSTPASVFVPHKVTRSKSLSPCCPVGFPPEAAGLRGQPTAPPRHSPTGRSPFPASLLGPKRASPTPVSDARSLSQPHSAAPLPLPTGLPSTSPPFLQTPLSPPPAPGPAGGPRTPFLFPFPATLSSGAHLARPPPPARLHSERPPPESSRPRPAPGRIQFEAPQDLPGTLVLG